MLPEIDYHAILPEIVLGVSVVVVLVFDLFVRRKHLSMLVAFLGVAVALGAALSLLDRIGAFASDSEAIAAFGPTYVVDGFAVLFKIFFLVVALAVLAISYRYLREGRFFQGEYYFLLLASFLGMLTIASSRDLLMLFISLELISAPGFLLAGFRKRDPRSNEAAMKFFVIGILSAAVMLYGMSLIYGVTGTLSLTGIAESLGGGGAGLEPALGGSLLHAAAVLMVVAGFAFKVSAVPFHFWAPDTYEGSPIPVAAFLSVASKAAGFAGLLQLMFVGFLPLSGVWAPVFAALSIATMSIGNLVALQQRQVVRLLSYSSVAQAGYMLLPFALIGASPATDQQAFSAAVLYILIYAIMNLGAFAVAVAVSRESPGVLLQDFAGLGQRNPGLAVPMAAFMVSLGGVPPTAGFIGKLFIFLAAIAAWQEGLTIGAVLAVAMILNSVVSLYYYVAVVRQMFLVPSPEQSPLRVPALVAGVVLLAGIGVLAVGVFPNLLVQFPQYATLP